jgi:hypothetical protein
VVEGSRLASSDRSKGVGQMIEGTSEVLDRVASDGRDGDRGRLDTGEVVDRLVRLRSVLGPDFIGVCGEEGADLGLKITDVFFGPFDFRLDQSKPLLGRRPLASTHA